MTTWRLLNYQPYSAFENMAIDEAVFQETIKNKKPTTLRFFGWHPAAVSIGYFQELDERLILDRCRVAGVDIVRRITGGRAVYHADEITYSIASGTTEKVFPNDINGTYKKISLCLSRGLAELGIKAHLAEAMISAQDTRTDLTPSCFSVPSGNELLVAGRKICGSAQMRTHGGFLQHGSLLMTFDPEQTATLLLPFPSEAEIKKLREAVVAVNETLPSPISAETLCLALQKGFIAELGIDLSYGMLTPSELEASARLVEKYQSEAWNFDRKKESIRIG